MQVNNIGSLSMRGGRNENFYFCLLEYFPDNQRIFLKSLLPVKEEEAENRDDAIRDWILNFKVDKLVMDIPLSHPACTTCKRACPGANQCPEPSVLVVRKKMNDLLQLDFDSQAKSPKNYELERNKSDEILFNPDYFEKKSHEHLLSRSFKRKLKKGYTPYWNRPIDFYLWQYYFDPMLAIFNTSYDSFGNTSLMMLSRFNYIKRHFPQELELFEGQVNIILIELFRAKILTKNDFQKLFDIEEASEGRLNIIRKCETHFDIFIYNYDLDVLMKSQRAFESFILSLGGLNYLAQKNMKLPDWSLPEEAKFIIPSF